MQNQDKEKITALQNDYMKEQLKKVQYIQKQVIYRRRRLAILFCIALVVFSLIGLNLFNNYRRLNSLQNEVVEKKEEYQQIALNKAALETNVTLLKDEGYVAKLARKKYYMSKDGEVIYRYPGSESEEIE